MGWKGERVREHESTKRVRRGCVGGLLDILSSGSAKMARLPQMLISTVLDAKL